MKMRKNLIVWFVLFIIFILTGCGLGNTNGPANDNENTDSSENGEEMEGEEAVIIVNGLEYSMDVIFNNGSLKVEMKLKNIGEETRVVEFASGHQFDVIIRDAQGELLYNFADDKMFTQAIIIEELAPNGELVFQDEWVDEQVEISIPLKVGTKLNIYQIDGSEIKDSPFQLVKTINN